MLIVNQIKCWIISSSSKYHKKKVNYVLDSIQNESNEMNKLKKHIFVCENIRDESHPKQSCGRLGGIEIRNKFKSRLRELGLNQTIRANSAGCLDACKHGPVVVVYPEGRWYGNVKLDDVEEIIQSDLINTSQALFSGCNLLAGLFAYYIV